MLKITILEVVRPLSIYIDIGYLLMLRNWKLNSKRLKMNINPKSQIHKFMTLGFTGSNRDNKIPTNLCPYMRNFILHLLMSIIFYALIVFNVYAALVAPVLWFMHDLGSGLRTVWLLGTAVDILLIMVGIAWLTRQMKLGEPVSRFAGKTAIRIHKSLFWQWAIAVHDKICPEITFDDDESNDG